MFNAEELQHIPVLACLPDSERTQIAQMAADLHLCEGEWVVREGETPWFYVLVDGELELVKEINGRPVTMKTYKGGDFFGEVPLLLGAPAFASIRAKKTSRVLRLDRTEFKAMIDNSPECSALIMKTMTARVNWIQEYARDVPAARVLVVGSQYDTDCRDIRSFLSVNRIPYEWVDREREPERIPACMSRVTEGPVVVIDRERCVGQPPTVRKVAEALGFSTAPKQSEYDVVIVGAGPAGLAAAVYGSSEGLSVLLVERSTVGGQAGTSSRIENYLGFPQGISGDELSDRAMKQAAKFETDIVVTREVESIYPLEQRYCVEMDGGDRVTGRCVILATGVAWRRLEADGVDRLQGRGVLYGASKTEAITAIGKDVFIVGGGNSAGQAAMFFASYARSVTMLVRGPKLEFSMSQYLIEQIERRPNIKVEVNTRVISVDGESHLESVCTQTKGEDQRRSRSADALFVMIGADAQTDWLPKQLVRDERGYICTGRDLPERLAEDRPPYLLETNLPGFFCVGDVRHDSIKRVSSSVGEGSMAIAFVHLYLAMQQRARMEAPPVLVS